jgi:hypothetical protein
VGIKNEEAYGGAKGEKLSPWFSSLLLPLLSVEPVIWQE